MSLYEKIRYLGISDQEAESHLYTDAEQGSRHKLVDIIAQRVRLVHILHSPLGLDTSNVTVETVPLILNTRPSRRITPI